MCEVVAVANGNLDVPVLEKRVPCLIPGGSLLRRLRWCRNWISLHDGIHNAGWKTTTNVLAQFAVYIQCVLPVCRIA